MAEEEKNDVLETELDNVDNPEEVEHLQPPDFQQT